MLVPFFFINWLLKLQVKNMNMFINLSLQGYLTVDMISYHIIIFIYPRYKDRQLTVDIQGRGQLLLFDDVFL